MSFEILLNQPAFERVALPYVQNLARLGITARVRTVDPAQYQRLMDSFDFDMTVAVFGESDSPGNEQVGYWTCASAEAEGSDNLAGVAARPSTRSLTASSTPAAASSFLQQRMRLIACCFGTGLLCRIGTCRVFGWLTGTASPSGEADPRGAGFRNLVGGSEALGRD